MGVFKSPPCFALHRRACAQSLLRPFVLQRPPSTRQSCQGTRFSWQGERMAACKFYPPPLLLLLLPLLLRPHVRHRYLWALPRNSNGDLRFGRSSGMPHYVIHVNCQLRFAICLLTFWCAQGFSEGGLHAMSWTVLGAGAEDVPT